MDQEQRRPVTAGDGMEAHVTGVDVAAREDISEPRRQMRCSRDRTRSSQASLVARRGGDGPGPPDAEQGSGGRGGNDEGSSGER